MIRVQEYEEFKIKEFIGDALLAFIVREFVCADWSMKNTQIVEANKMCSNEFLSFVAKEIGLEPFHFDNDYDNLKRFANAVEVNIYEIFQTHGFGSARTWVIKNIIERYYNAHK